MRYKSQKIKKIECFQNELMCSRNEECLFLIDWNLYGRIIVANGRRLGEGPIFEILPPKPKLNL